MLALNVMEVLKNLVLACEANGLRSLPFVQDARRILDGPPSPVAELVKELREAASEEEADHVQQDHYHSEILTKAADILEAVAFPKPIVGWETEAEWQMEQEMFHACGRADVPKDVQKLVGKMWREYCAAKAPSETAFVSSGFTEEQVELVRLTYLSCVNEYDRDFERDDKAEDFWQEKYGTILHSTALGRQWAMRKALETLLPATGSRKV